MLCGRSNIDSAWVSVCTDDLFAENRVCHATMWAHTACRQRISRRNRRDRCSSDDRSRPLTRWWTAFQLSAWPRRCIRCSLRIPVDFQRFVRDKKIVYIPTLQPNVSGLCKNCVFGVTSVRIRFRLFSTLPWLYLWLCIGYYRRVWVPFIRCCINCSSVHWTVAYTLRYLSEHYHWTPSGFDGEFIFLSNEHSSGLVMHCHCPHVLTSCPPASCSSRRYTRFSQAAITEGTSTKCLRSFPWFDVSA